MTPGITPAKRFAIRTSLVAGSSLALIVGAQTLIAIDIQSGRMSIDGSALSTNKDSQLGGQITTSGVTVIRQSNAPSYVLSGNDDSNQSEELFNQGLPYQSDQRNQLFSSQQTFRRPRTHSSR